jgi:hypothetical protein
VTEQEQSIVATRATHARDQLPENGRHAPQHDRNVQSPEGQPPLQRRRPCDATSRPSARHRVFVVLKLLTNAHDNVTGQRPRTLWLAGCHSPRPPPPTLAATTTTAAAAATTNNRRVRERRWRRTNQLCANKRSSQRPRVSLSLLLLLLLLLLLPS